MGDAGFGLLGIAVLLGLVLVVCWIVLPFAVIGTKPLLRELLREQRRTNELLSELARPVRGAGPAGPPPGSRG